MVATDIKMALDNLSSTAITKTDALDAQVAANKQLAEAFAHITKQNEKLLAMVSQLTTQTMKPKPHKEGTQNSHCWSHSFVMSANHNSKMCSNKAPTSQHLNDGAYQQGNAVATVTL